MFYVCEQALTVRMSALPAVYATKNYAQALYSMAWSDTVDSHLRDYWNMFVTLICLSMHIPFEYASSQIKIMASQSDNSELKALVITQHKQDGEVVKRLEPSELGQIRTIIATLNGCDLPDESENLELIEADEDVRLLNATANLEYSIDDMIATVARDQHKRISELDNWTIWEFNMIRKAIERERRFTICGIGEAGGMVKWQNGNPYPSLFFDKKQENLGIVSAESFKQRVGGAVQIQDTVPIGMSLPNQ